ncbi:hypothetical protein OQJ13_10010 [Legionella sp. PATHC035]|uniref:hypothetical protein n=1 Tax=Legionella sp. PATHC035 TaxID=2992040 RepID=UPI002243202C|nr:hypothetical protein [Legionella sp. PATHC035]MCW8409306.1 hypothetical protein [Legionella sp. PATHC035]
MGGLGAFEVSSVGEVLTHHAEITPALIEEMLKSPIAEDFFDPPFYFPLNEKMLEQLKRYELDREKFQNRGKVIDKKLAQKHLMEEQLIELVTRIIQKQQELAEDPQYFNRILVNRMKALEKALELIDDKMESLQYRQKSPGFFDTEENLRTKISRLQLIKDQLETTFFRYYLACKPSQISKKMAANLANLLAHDSGQDSELAQLEELRSQVQGMLKKHPQLSMKYKAHREREQKEMSKWQMVSLFPAEEPEAEDLFDQQPSLEEQFSYRRTMLVKAAHHFLQESKNQLSKAFTEANKYTLEETSEQRHNNPFMIFLDKVLHCLTRGFCHISTDTESVIEKASKALSYS